MSYWKAIKTLWPIAIAFWLAAVVMAVFHENDPVRSLAQGIAITLSVAALVGWRLTREPRSKRVTSSDNAGYTYVSTNALTDQGPITMEIRESDATVPIRKAGHTAGHSLARVPAELLGQLFRLGATDSGGGGPRRLRP